MAKKEKEVEKEVLTPKKEVKVEVKDERDPDLPDNKQRWLR